MVMVGKLLVIMSARVDFTMSLGLVLYNLKEYYRIGFASKKVAGSVSTLCNPPYT